MNFKTHPNKRQHITDAERQEFINILLRLLTPENGVDTLLADGVSPHEVLASFQESFGPQEVQGLLEELSNRCSCEKPIEPIDIFEHLQANDISEEVACQCLKQYLTTNDSSCLCDEVQYNDCSLQSLASKLKVGDAIISDAMFNKIDMKALDSMVGSHVTHTSRSGVTILSK